MIASDRDERIAKIDTELEQLYRKCTRLLADRALLEKQGYIGDSRFWSLPVLAQIKLNPGITRAEILDNLNMGFDPSDKELTNAITSLRRNGFIENHGTRKNPRWFVKETQS